MGSATLALLGAIAISFYLLTIYGIGFPDQPFYVHLGAWPLAIVECYLFGVIVLALILSVWRRQLMWTWGLGLLLAVELFGALGLSTGSTNYTFPAIVPPVVILIYGWTLRQNKRTQAAPK